MKMFCLFALFALTASADDDLMLSAALSSPQAMVSLYSSFEKSHGRHYQPAEERMRLKIFQKSVQDVAALNSHTSWRSAINDFADKTEEEKQSYLGLNISLSLDRPTVSAPRLTSVGAAPASKSWISEGAVTEVKNQGGCGSCWIFGAVSALEGQYKVLTGVLRDMSENNILDCSSGDGCWGGWMKTAINWAQANGNRLASTSDYPYVGRDGSCKAPSDNVIKGATIIRYTELSTQYGLNEVTTINALAQGPLSITLAAISSFQSYSSGIYADTKTTAFPNHALAAVAYTSKYILIKNSWGSSWGDDGYIKVARNWYGCSMHMFVGYPELTSSGVIDNSPSDPVTAYAGETDDGSVDPKVCEDTVANCQFILAFCNTNTTRAACQKSCGACDDTDDGSCASGTTRCPDGQCRHIHMC